MHLKLQHGFAFIGLEHEAERPYSCAGVIRLLSVPL